MPFLDPVHSDVLEAGFEVARDVSISKLDKCLEFVIVDDLTSEVHWSKAVERVDGVKSLKGHEHAILSPMPLRGHSPCFVLSRAFHPSKRVVLTS